MATNCGHAASFCTALSCSSYFLFVPPNSNRLSLIPPSEQCCTIFLEGMEFFIEGQTHTFHITRHVRQDGAIRSKPCSEEFTILTDKHSDFISNQNCFWLMLRKIRLPNESASCVATPHLRQSAAKWRLLQCVWKKSVAQQSGHAFTTGMVVKTELPHSNLIFVILGPN
jgi:hypothetical protein